MTTLQQLAATRTAGLVIAREEARAYAEPEPFADACGLFGGNGIYREVPFSEAAAVLQAILHADLAYHAELMSSTDAQALATAFMAEYKNTSARFYTNGEFGQRRSNPQLGPSWMPATNASFDTGLLVLASHRSVCVWVQDED